MMADQRLGIKEANDAIWLATFMYHDLGDVHLDRETLQTIDNPFGGESGPAYEALLDRPCGIASDTVGTVMSLTTARPNTGAQSAIKGIAK